MKEYYVYILSNKFNGVLYIGVISYIIKHVWQHKQKIIKVFTTKYNLDKIVYFKQFNDVNHAMNRDKHL